ncbi:DUF4373 domain-containing protein [Bacteroides faecis]|mgnify:FL=1|jgi:hypothetical protein|uniref:DUF4373 domain-containing protein n=1 Tax=Bacteroides faecis TaxID=674529 RepID=UPI002053B0E1|nr:MAG TPA: protein of unknown function (DUF4373) [Caudoviricetes sp.]DAM63472.1 MAG TPA: protein of unknown function (DUF4373) [Caudoviricetes sp.]
MAGRPTKQGIDYFPMDVGFFTDVKIRKISRACGSQSTSILICLLCNIYKDEGYYILWDEDLPFVIADTVGVSEGAVKEVLIKSLQVGFFDQELYEKYKILTSSGIQKRFLLATYQRKETTIIPEYLINCANNSINCTNNSINHSDNEQSKSKVKVNRKKRKEKENNKETSPNGEEKKDELSLSHSQKIDWVGLMNWYNSLFRDKLPAIKSMTETRKKAVKARIAQYGKESIRTVFNLVLQSSFLLGGNDHNWKCDFDWIFKQANYTKILEGNYNGKRADTATTRRESVSRLKQLAGAILQGAESKKD